MDSENQIVNVIDENGMPRKVEILLTFELMSSGNRYCICSYLEDDKVDILGLLVSKDEYGYDKLENITNMDDKKQIYDIIYKLSKQIGFDD